jgi:hypothetical protein
VEGKIAMGGCDTITVQKKQKFKEWKQNPTHSSPDPPAWKLFCGVCGINSNVTGHLREEVRTVHVLNMFI